MRYSLTHNLHLQVQNYNNFLIIATSSLPFHRHLILLRHFLCEGFLAILFDIADAGGTVAVEQESKDLANKIVMNLAFLYILVACSTGMDAFDPAAFAYLAPLKPLGKGVAQARIVFF